jgi:hypothetical protein
MIWRRSPRVRLSLSPCPFAGFVPIVLPPGLV